MGWYQLLEMSQAITLLVTARCLLALWFLVARQLTMAHQMLKLAHLTPTLQLALAQLAT